MICFRKWFSWKPTNNRRFPRFDGLDHMGWIFKITQFFEYHCTPEHNRLTITSFCMEGPALPWFQWMGRNGQLPSWTGLLQALKARFAPSTYNDPTCTLFKLTQHNSINNYLSEFSSLANWIIGLPTPFLLSCFVFDLALKIHHAVQALQPLKLIQAVALARLQVKIFVDSWRTTCNKPTPSSPLLPTPTKYPPIPLKRLSFEEIAKRREKGLCFNCDDKFTRGHKWSMKVLCLDKI